MCFYIKICFQSDGFIAYSNEWDWREKTMLKKYLFFAELARNKRWSAIFCATGVWGGKPIGRVRVNEIFKFMIIIKYILAWKQRQLNHFLMIAKLLNKARNISFSNCYCSEVNSHFCELTVFLRAFRRYFTFELITSSVLHADYLQWTVYIMSALYDLNLASYKLIETFILAWTLLKKICDFWITFFINS